MRNYGEEYFRVREQVGYKSCSTSKKGKCPKTSRPKRLRLRHREASDVEMAGKNNIIKPNVKTDDIIPQKRRTK